MKKETCPSCNEPVPPKAVTCKGCGLELRYSEDPPYKLTGHKPETRGRPEFFRIDSWSPPQVPFKTSYANLLFYFFLGAATFWVLLQTMPDEWRYYFSDGVVEVTIEP